MSHAPESPDSCDPQAAPETLQLEHKLRAVLHTLYSLNEAYTHLLGKLQQHQPPPPSQDVQEEHSETTPTMPTEAWNAYLRRTRN